MAGYNYQRLHGGVYLPKDDLGQLKRRLHPGQRIRSRVIEQFERNQILLRVWNYNILTHSESHFDLGTELTLMVEAVEPKFQFRLINDRENTDNVDLRIE